MAKTKHPGDEQSPNAESDKHLTNRSSSKTVSITEDGTYQEK
jgi:hypothetical protein